MRRLIAFTILLTSGWSQYSATHCAMGLSSPPPAATGSFAPVAVAHPHAHGHHAQSASPASQSSASPRSSAAEAPTRNRPVDTGCPLALACASAALNSASHGIAAPPAAAGGEIRVRFGDHEAVPLTRDPPPPRLRV